MHKDFVLDGQDGADGNLNLISLVWPTFLLDQPKLAEMIRTRLG